jgi:hypothetical protein
MMCSRILSIAFAGLILLCSDFTLGAQWRFDCGKADGPVADGCSRLTNGDQYDPARKYGWLSPDGYASNPMGIKGVSDAASGSWES